MEVDEDIVEDDLPRHPGAARRWRPQDLLPLLHVAGAGAAVVYFGLWRESFYPWLASTGPIFALALAGLVGAVPLVRMLHRDGRFGLAVWTVAATVLVVLAAGRASADAQRQLYYNCWTLSGDPAEEIVACAPGSEPEQGSHYSRWTESGSFRDCEYLRDGDAGISIWRCEQGDL